MQNQMDVAPQSVWVLWCMHWWAARIHRGGARIPSDNGSGPQVWPDAASLHDSQSDEEASAPRSTFWSGLQTKLPSTSCWCLARWPGGPRQGHHAPGSLQRNQENSKSAEAFARATFSSYSDSSHEVVVSSCPPSSERRQQVLLQWRILPPLASVCEAWWVDPIS